MLLRVYTAGEQVEQGDALPSDLEACWRTACPNDNLWEDLNVEMADALRTVDPGDLRSVTLRIAGEIEVCAAPKRVLEALGAGIRYRLEHPLYPEETVGVGSR